MSDKNIGRRFVIVQAGFGSDDLALYQVIRETDKRIYIFPSAIHGRAMYDGAQSNAHFPKSKILVDYATEELYRELAALYREQALQVRELHRAQREQAKVLHEQHEYQRQEVLQRHQQTQEQHDE